MDVTGPDAPEKTQEDLIGGKFKSVDDLLASYKALEGKLGQATRDPAEPVEIPKPGDTKPVEGQVDDQGGENDKDDAAAEDDDPYGPAVSTALESAGLDIDAVSKEFLDSGDLSDDSYAALQEAGFSKPLVQVYLNGLKASAAEAQAGSEADIIAVEDAVGGQAEYGRMLAWAKQSLSPEEAEAYNAVVTGSDANAAKWAARGLHAQFKTARGSRPNLLHGRAGRQETEGFQSREQMQAAMRDPRYTGRGKTRRDPAYIAEVERRVAASKFIERR